MGNTHFIISPSVPLEQTKRNVRSAKRRHLREVSTLKRWGPLAVVGGGPSAREHLDTLREWPGDIWAINGAWAWCVANGVHRAQFFTIDPSPKILLDLGNWTGIPGIVATCVDPTVLDRMDAARTAVFTLGKGRIYYHSTSATAAPSVAQAAGHDHVIFVGCEGSFLEDETGYRSHVYGPEKRPHLVRVMCGGQAFLTDPGMLTQTEKLAHAIREYPFFLAERSGGLLRAMVEHGDYEQVDFKELRGGNLDLYRATDGDSELGGKVGRHQDHEQRRRPDYAGGIPSQP